MAPQPDSSLQQVEGFILVSLIVLYALAYVITRLRRRRPDFNIALPIVVAIVLRVLVVAAINATGSLQSQLRGGDETYFLSLAHILAGTPWGRGFLPHGPFQLQTEVFAVQLKLLNVSATTLRVTQIGIALLGFILILAAVYDLAGGRPARLAAWLLAFEPASLFFNSALHKEPLMVLASGLVVFGATRLWRRLDLIGVLLSALGGLIGIETRSYAGWFLVSASVLLLLHAALRRLDRPGRSLPVIYAIVALAFLVTPTLVTITSNKSLQTLQSSQNANTGVTGSLSTTGANSDNLALEQVDFSTRGAVITNLPARVFDLIFRPFPWQLGDTSQRLGAVGTMVALFALLLLVRYAWLGRDHFVRLTAPILYPTFFLLIAYSLSAGNAGTGFRYRTHLVVLEGAMLVVMREHALRAKTQSQDLTLAPDDPERQPLTPSLLPA